MNEIWLVLKYLFLGVLQGFTEPIPVSSSGHLVIAQHILDLEIEGLGFEVLVNFASLLAVLLIYRSDLLRLISNGTAYVLRRDPEARADFRFILYLVIATVPAALLGLLFNDVFNQLKGLLTVGITLIITGVALWLIRNLKGRKKDGDLRIKDAIIIGFAQAIALIPGISRSGATIVAAMGLGLKQETALRFSFLMFIPISVGGMVLEGTTLARDPQLGELLLPYTVAFIGSLIASYYALRWFMGLMQRGNLKYFSYYCFIIGGAIILYHLV